MTLPSGCKQAIGQPDEKDRAPLRKHTPWKGLAALHELAVSASPLTVSYCLGFDSNHLVQCEARACQNSQRMERPGSAPISREHAPQTQAMKLQRRSSEDQVRVEDWIPNGMI